jgi:RHS repeat-associated protein
MSRVVAELNDNLSLKATYVYGGQQLLKEEPTSGNRSHDVYLLSDGIVGSITHATDSSGQVKDEYRYDAFGIRSTASQTSSSHGHYGYTGQEYDEESGLLYLRARYYDPSIGRFISADPFWGRLEEPASQNRYTYVHNNPLIYSDPSGLDTLQFNLCTGGGAGLDGSFCTTWGIQYRKTDSFPYFECQGKYSYDTAAVGVTSGVGFANTFGVQWTNASSWQQHLGMGNETGGSVPVMGLGVLEGNAVVGQDYVGLNLNFGVGLGTPETHSRSTYTWDSSAGEPSNCMLC